MRPPARTRELNRQTPETLTNVPASSTCLTCGFSYLLSGDMDEVSSPHRVDYSPKLPPGIEQSKFLETGG